MGQKIDGRTIYQELGIKTAIAPDKAFSKRLEQDFVNTALGKPRSSNSFLALPLIWRLAFLTLTAALIGLAGFSYYQFEQAPKKSQPANNKNDIKAAISTLDDFETEALKSDKELPIDRIQKQAFKQDLQIKAQTTLKGELSVGKTPVNLSTSTCQKSLTLFFYEDNQSPILLRIYLDGKLVKSILGETSINLIVADKNQLSIYPEICTPTTVNSQQGANEAGSSDNKSIQGQSSNDSSTPGPINPPTGSGDSTSGEDGPDEGELAGEEDDDDLVDVDINLGGIRVKLGLL